MAKTAVIESIEADRDRIESVADTLWENPELALQETESAELLVSILSEEGFDVTEGIGGMPTAFTASYGEGSPTIGILGEYDALPGLSQSVSATRDPVEKGGDGHGCGHNVFGAGSLGGALAIKDAIDAGELDGEIVYYGCPAEETLVGKTFMARAGVFDDLDAALTWHPSQLSYPFKARTLAMNSVSYEFQGESAHAANSPDSGRSALDAVQLMNQGVEYMREHIPDEARVHYTIKEGGGAPNVVPAEAEVWYYIRAPDRDEVERIHDWLDDIAEAAAMMSQTSMTQEFITGCHSYLPNDHLSEVVYENMQEVGEIPFTEEDRTFAAELKDTLPEETIESQMAGVPDEKRDEILDEDLYSVPQRSFDEGEVHAGSTEVGDVSWITPVAQFWGCAWPVGTPSHTWQAVAANGDFSKKTAVYAAKVLAGTVYDLFEDPELLQAARTEFETETEGRQYESPLPEGTEPPFESELL